MPWSLVRKWRGRSARRQSDIVLELERELRLEVLPISGGYERWNVWDRSTRYSWRRVAGSRSSELRERSGGKTQLAPG